jgi:hypothetical protein
MADGSTGSSSVSPAPGLILTLVNALREQADAVAALVQTRPIPHTFPMPPRGWWNALAFALAGADAPLFSAGMRSEETRYGFTGYAFGLFDRPVTSGCALSFGSTRDADPRVEIHTYGGSRVTDWLTTTLAAWEAAGAPQPDTYHITASPQPSTATSLRGFIVDLPHWRLLIEHETSAPE